MSRKFNSERKRNIIHLLLLQPQMHVYSSCIQVYDMPQTELLQNKVLR